MKSIKYILGFLFVAVLLQGVLTSAQTYQVNYTLQNGASSLTSFEVQTLKYSPYPVNAGDWFDIWILVQNVGKDDARNVKFQLSQDYPFSSEDSIRTFGFIYGVTNAYSTNMGGDANVALLKYRVKTADNAPAGESNLKLLVGVNGNDPSTGVGVDLPITIAETKTDFDVVSQGSTTQGTSFAISNIGSNTASAITVTFNSGRGPPQSSIIGNLNAGDFTTVTFPTVSVGNSTSAAGAAGARRAAGSTPVSNESFQNRPSSVSQMTIAYTDIAGVRDATIKNVTLISSASFGSQRTTTATTTSSSRSVYIYLILGVIIGVFLILGYQKIKRKK